MEQLTTNELRTLVWMCQNEAAHIAKGYKKDRAVLLKNHETYQRILSISRKAYNELTDRNNAE